jgi:uncharacterized protein
VRNRLLFLAGMLLLAALQGAAQPPAQPLAQPMEIPDLREYATDRTLTLSQDQLSALNRKLLQFDQQTSTQIVVLMVATTGDLSIEEAALKVAERNRIGKQGRDNGTLLLVAKEDRAVRIEVGRGLEGVLPDVLAGQIIRKEIIPKFREGDMAGGIFAGVEAMIQATRNEYTADPVQDQKEELNILPILVVIFVLYLMMRSRKGGRGGFGGFPPIIGGGWGSGGGGGFSGGGFSGGGFSGGGGSFSGGGASGRW